MAEQALESWFPTTDWSVLSKTGQSQNAMEQVLRRYLPPLRQHLIQARRMSPQDAEDLLQEFVLDKVIRGQLLERVDRERGLFRTFLLTVLNNYRHNVQRFERRHHLPTEPLSESRHELSHEDESSLSFDLAWAKHLLDETFTRMHEHCRAAGRLDIWSVFVSRVAREGSGCDDLVRELDASSTLRSMSVQQACNLMITGRRMYARILRALVSEYVGDKKEAIEIEIAELKEIASRRGLASRCSGDHNGHASQPI